MPNGLDMYGNPPAGEYDPNYGGALDQNQQEEHGVTPEQQDAKAQQDQADRDSARMLASPIGNYVPNDVVTANNNRYRGDLYNMQNDSRAQMAQAYAQNQDARGFGYQTRDQMQDLSRALTEQSNGQGPSLAQMQLQQGSERNLQDAMAMAASSRGGSRAAAFRQVQAQRNVAGQQLGQQSGMVRLQEQMAARQQLASHLANMRSQDMQARGQDMQMYGMGQQGLMGSTQMGMGLEQQQFANDMTERDQMIRAWSAQKNYEVEQSKSNNALWGGVLGAAGAVGVGLLGAFGGGKNGASSAGTGGTGGTGGVGTGNSAGYGSSGVG